jgi:predicted permease
VSFSEDGVFSGTESAMQVSIAGFDGHTKADNTINYDQVGPGYVGAIGAHLIAGRDISRDDKMHGPSVAVINESLARFYFGAENPVGRVINIDEKYPATVVGVVGDIKDHSLLSAPVRRAYLSYLQQLGGGDEPEELVYEIRTTGDPSSVTKAVRAAVGAVDPALPITSLEPLAVTMRESVRTERLLARLTTGFGVLALLLAAIGLYGVMSYAMARRTGEIGLRMALGAGSANVVRLVLRDALWLVGVGLLAGVPAALACTRLIGAQLHGVTGADPGAIGVAVGVLAGTAFVAALIPALRAARTTPVVALQSD